MRLAPLDRLSHFATKATGVEWGARKLYDTAGYLLDRYTPEQVKAGVVSDYGIPQAVTDQRTLVRARQLVQLRKTGKLIDALGSLTRAESRVAYEWMNTQKTDQATLDRLTEGLPAESVAVLREVERMIDHLSREAIRMGQLSPEAYERNKFAYLHRSYSKHVLEQTGVERARRKKVVAILGDQYKGRGLSDAVPMARIKQTDWWQRKEAAARISAPIMRTPPRGSIPARPRRCRARPRGVRQSRADPPPALFARSSPRSARTWPCTLKDQIQPSAECR